MGIVTYYTHLRGLVFFLECTGNAFEGRYPGKISDIGEQAIRSLAVGKQSWVWDKPREIPKHRLN
jgi:hypothetical protein